MENTQLTFAEDALESISKKAIARKTGARGLRSIMEGILLDTMFDLPGMEGVERNRGSTARSSEGKAKPLFIYADRRDDVGSAPEAERPTVCLRPAGARAPARRRRACLMDRAFRVSISCGQ